ncbi:Hypothetical predicted protein [Olea europaea subsp. europaea]|uniref:Ribosomal protein L2 n=1 Tax=Olea europaea subsp. europaea TaxID=158383 RepID=A0A8S0RPQ5_OLEEU|nr:Hypothetical predicted protein [Olea europaea subsp. europaea]
MGSGALVLVWSYPSVIAVPAYLMSVQRRERSEPWKDRVSDCGVRGASGERKRGASGELLKGRDRGSPIPVLLSPKHAKLRSSDGIRCVRAGMVAPVSNYGPSVFDVSLPSGAFATAEGSGQRFWGLRCRWRSKARGQLGALVGTGKGKKIALVARRHVKVQSSDGIRCVSAGMVAPIGNYGPSVLDVNPAPGAFSTEEGPGQRLQDPRSGGDRKRGSNMERL